TSLFHHFGGREGMLVFAHERTIPQLDSGFVVTPSDRRSEFEQWWEELLKRLRSRYGAVLLAIRPTVAAKRGLNSLEREEVLQLPQLRQWIVAGAGLGAASTVAILRTTWRMLLDAAGEAAGS